MDALITTLVFISLYGFALLLAFKQKPTAFIVGVLLTNIMGIVFTAVAYKLDLSPHITALFLCGLLIGNLVLLFKKEIGIFWTVPINWVQFSQTSSEIDVLGSGQIMTLPQATLNKDDMRSLGTRPFRFSFELERANTVFIAVISGSYKPGSDSGGNQDAALVKYFQLGTEAAAYAAIGVDLAGNLKPWIQERIEGVADNQVRGQVHRINAELAREVDMIDPIEARNGIDLQVKLEDLALPAEFQEVRELRNRLQTVIDLGFWVHEQYAQKARGLDEEVRKHMPGFDKLQKLIESLMAGDPQGNVFAARGGRGGQGVAPFALLNLAPRDPAGQGTPVVITNPEVKIPEKGATPAKAVVFTIAALMALAAVVWNVLVIEKTWHSGVTVVNNTVTEIAAAIPSTKTEPQVYRKMQLDVDQNWSVKLETYRNQDLTVWPIDGLEGRTNNQDLIRYNQGEGHGSHSWLQLRVASGAGKVTYCHHPKGTSWKVCQ